MTHVKKYVQKTALLTMTMLSLSACSAVDRISRIGEAPDMARIEDPTLQSGYQPVSLPMPTPESSEKQPNSLWASNRKNFFKDQRAGKIGDILTVIIEVKDTAALDNETEQKRTSSENAALDSLLGYEASLGKVLPDAIDPANLVGADADSNFKGTGTIARGEEVDLQLAAIVTQILPNGNLVIHGKQEIRVNYEKRIVAVDGVIRPEDISINNTIDSNQIAEARIAYGGEGHLTDVQQPRYGQQLYDIVFPF
ncbi:MAG: flagellar basal body L-ring protein FlgH [Rhodospirillales bacterium]|nr:flagellar basal body L-ring protein FlgH [Rhodospirillales bacterium]MCB9965270.1 flagellar basal body L-ring protein FlgH [Rhodospirillales bacterium]MCB9972960.1 flagellar basal body L-ring protein FlgH [Rhodospirillales bacterium]MCB9980052.1 flagellar basal body L-ring protein FlgH [Rhodospirillales bacterium]